MNLDDRMKHYESTVGSRLVLRCPAIVRCDGRAFHTFTKPFERPFDGLFRSLMVKTAQHLCEEISTARFAYGQSDEISILLIDYTRFETDQFFDGKVQKLASVIASEATVAFNEALWKVVNFPIPAFADMVEPLKKSLFKATFDARVFSVPERDAGNYFIWRQQDAIRNSVQSLGQAHFSHKELQGKSAEEIKTMLIDKPQSTDEPWISWESQPAEFKYGFTVQNYKTDSISCGSLNAEFPGSVLSRWVHAPAIVFDGGFFHQFLEPEED